MRDKATVIGLVVLVVADVLLVTLAFRHVGAGETAASAGVSHASAPVTKTPPTAAPQPAAFLSVRGDGTMLRASRGDCHASTAPQVTVSSGTGKAFVRRTVPGLRGVVDTRTSPSGTLVLTGLGDHCHVERFASGDDGTTWTRQAGEGPIWHLLPGKGSTSVHSPQGTKRVPCRAASLSAPAAGPVRVLCLDGRIYGTDDSGATWPYLGRLRQAVDIDFAGPTDGFAVAKTSDCPAAVMRSVDGGGTWSQIRCLPGRTPLAIATAGSVVAAQVDDHTFVSKDDGITWPSATRR